MKKRWLLLILLLIPLLVGASDPTCNSGDGCKVNCQGGDLDCSCSEQFGYLCLENQVCSTSLLSSDTDLCCTVPCFDTCNEIWMCTEWSDCYENNTQYRICTEITDCGTENEKPSMTKSCTYKQEVVVIIENTTEESSEEISIEEPECIEQWSCQDWNTIPCSSSGIKSRTCRDLNDCHDVMGRKTYNNMPALTQTCVYTAKCINNIKDADESDVDCGGPCGATCEIGKFCLTNNDCTTKFCLDNICLCKEEWACGDWSICSNGMQRRICQDINDCGTEINKPSIQQACLDKNLLKKQHESKTETNETFFNIPSSIIDLKGKQIMPLVTPFLLILFILFFSFLYIKTEHKTYLALAVISLILLVIPSILKQQKITSPTKDVSSWSILLMVMVIYFLLFALVYYLAQTKHRKFIISNPFIKKIFFIQLYDNPPKDVLKNYISYALRKGRSLDSVKRIISAIGWSKDFIEKSFKDIHVKKEPKTKLTDFLVSVLKYAPKIEKRIINLLLHREGYTISQIKHKLGLSDSQVESALKNLYNKKVIRFDGLRIYFSKEVK